MVEVARPSDVAIVETHDEEAAGGETGTESARHPIIWVASPMISRTAGSALSPNVS